jgi:restriction system protein
MSIPDFQTLMLPVLRLLGDGKDRTSAEIRGAIAAEFTLTPADLAQMLPSGRQATFNNRVAWAQAYLKQAGLVESPKRGVYRITARGKGIAAQAPSRIDIEFLTQFPEFQAFRSSPAKVDSPLAVLAGTGTVTPPLTPDEEMRAGYARLRQNLGTQVLERVKQLTPQQFEELVVDLLVKMGYGGTHEDAASVVGRSGDEGIDGIIKEDKLGLDAIYIQAKRWKDTVGRPDIQRFAGALQGQRARKGVFITTSTFSSEAEVYAANLQTTIVLIDGPRLSQLMIDAGIGVSTAETLRILKLDEDYFAEE